jgi:hypothetical protein
VYFVGYTDATNAPRGIEASYEPQWKNDYPPPTGVKPTTQEAR